MVLKTKEFKKMAAIILNAVESGGADILELQTKDNVLYLNVTNNEYYVSVKFLLDREETFHATVNADLFLKLVAQITTENLELSCSDKYVLIKANGNYKLPLIYRDQVVLVLPEICIENPTINMDIEGNKLVSMLVANSEELLKTGKIKQPVQNLYYLDQEGCITFTDGACVNGFNLEKPMKVLLSNSVVKLFKLFKDKTVHFILGYDADASGNIKTKVSFITDTIKLNSLTPSNDVLLTQVPVSTIRGLANKMFNYSVVVNRQELDAALTRLLLFINRKEALFALGSFVFDNGALSISDVNEGKDNIEYINLETGSKGEGKYSFNLVLVEVKNILDTCTEDYLTINFGDNRAVVFVRGTTKYILPEKIIVKQ